MFALVTYICLCALLCVYVCGLNIKCPSHFELWSKMFESKKYNKRDLTETILYFFVAYISQTTLANFLPLLDKGKIIDLMF